MSRDEPDPIEYSLANIADALWDIRNLLQKLTERTIEDVRPGLAEFGDQVPVNPDLPPTG